MKQYLLAISIGPVQGFIAAARRTRDLWFGSYILSEVSKAVAKSLHDQKANLIFPAPANEKMLEPDSELLVTNHILALLSADLKPEEVSEQAQRAAQNRWRSFTDSTVKAVGRNVINMDIWDEQIDDVLEIYSAWVPWNSGSTQDTTYQHARNRLDLVLAGRKALRDFQPARGRAGVPKSSLDGARESVLTGKVSNNENIRRYIKVKKQEHLDSVGLVKRCAPLPGNEEDIEFVSVVRVAADPWIRGKAQTQEGKQLFLKIGELCHSDFAPRIRSDVYAEFPYDATPLYSSRLNVLLEDPDMRVHNKNLEEIKVLLSNAFLQGDQPQPYYAVLMADGDKIGSVLREMESPEEHKKFSNCLSAYSLEVRGIVENYQGCLVYSGGDDVLAFLPVDQCLSAAEGLHKYFSERLTAATRHLIGDPPTLSIGIAIGHCFDPLEDMLEAARNALHDAKTGREANCSEDRNGLALHYLTRGSEAISVRNNWNNRPSKRMETWIDFMKNDLLSTGAVYDLHALVCDYIGWKMESLDSLIIKDIKWMLSKKRPAGKRMKKEVIDCLKKEIKKITDLDRVANELLIARHMLSAYKQVDKQGETAGENEKDKYENGEGEK